MSVLPNFEFEIMRTVLRDYQVDVRDRVRDLARHLPSPVRIILQASTGAGKSEIGKDLLIRCHERGKRGLFIVSGRTLVSQFERHMQRAGVPHGVIMSGRGRTDAPVQIVSKETLAARVLRRAVMDVPPADLVIIDEAHESMAKEWVQLLERYSNALVIGLTATPALGNGKGLGAVYNGMECAVSTAQLVREGWLVPCKVFAPDKPNLKGIRLDKNGDYNREQLAQVMDKPKLTGNVLTNWKRHAEGRKTVIFGCTIDHAKHICDEFNAAGIRFRHIDQETSDEEREEIFGLIQDGIVQGFTNVSVARRGLDLPCLECACVVRPTRSLVLWLQMIGRIRRPSPGKTDCVVIDHAGACDNHCVLPNSIINGPTDRKANEVSCGNLVFGHDGKAHKVKQVFQRHYNGCLVRIAGNGATVVEVTEEHPVLVYRWLRVKRRGDTKPETSIIGAVHEGHGLATATFKTRQHCAHWIKAKNVRPGDYLVTPRLVGNDKRQSVLPNTDDVAWLIGYFAGDGHASELAINFYVTRKNLKRVWRGVKSLGLTPYILKRWTNGEVSGDGPPTSYTVTAHSRPVARQFREWFGHNSSVKRIPEFVFTDGWNLESVLAGLLAADGGVRDNGRVYLNTISRVLSNQVRIIAATLGKRPTINATKANRPGAFANAKPGWRVSWANGEKGTTKQAGGLLLTPVTAVSFVPYSGPVFNFHVEDANSFLVETFATHNCMPDDEIKWSLDSDRKIGEWLQEQKDNGKLPKQILCPKCDCIFSGTNRCPNCGHEMKEKPKHTKQVEYADGILVERDGSKSEYPLEDMQRWWNRCIAIAVNRNQKLGAAVHIFRSKYQMFPWEAEGLRNVPADRSSWQCQASELYPQFARVKVSK